MAEFIVGVRNTVYAKLYVRAESGHEAWEKAKAWQITEEDSKDVYLDEDRFYEDHWLLETLEEVD